MSYEKQTWQTGDVVTAEKLNHIEDGIDGAGGGGGSLLVTLVNGETFNKTWNEVKTAVVSGIPVYVLYVEVDTSEQTFAVMRSVHSIDGYDGSYIVNVIDHTEEMGFAEFSTNSADGYPAVGST